MISSSDTGPVRTDTSLNIPRRRKEILLHVNGKEFSLEVDSRVTLAEALRENLGLTGTKIGCNRAECGSCTVIVDGEAVYSCTMLAVSAARKNIQTIEGIASDDGRMHPIQDLFVKYDALQCGYCIPGIIMSMKAILDKGGNPSREEIRAGMAGNYCRCGAYPNIEKVAMTLSQAGK